jgi:ketosteroid isomerase-like protein
VRLKALGCDHGAVDPAPLDAWLGAYFAAWRSNDPNDVAALFTEDAIYFVGPFAEPWNGRDAIVERWTAGGAGEIDAAWDVLSVAERPASLTGTWKDAGAAREVDGILVLRFADDGRCREHREWYVARSLG